jgi:hypothetical protein
MANNNLVIKLSADIAKFQADMRTAGSSTQQAMAQMEKDAAMVGRAMGLMAVVGAGALTVMVKQSIDAADKLRDMSQKVGIAVSTLNGLGFAASQAGGSLDGMVSAAGKLNKSIAEGAQGNNDQAAAFKALGINVYDASGKLKTADVVMTEMASKFATFADGPEKVALSMALMGKAGADMIPVLNEGGEAMRANIEYSKQYSGMTTELANGADNFNDTMGKLQLQQQGFANTLTAAVLPILQAVADETLRAAEESNGFTVAANAARTVLETFVVVGSEVAFVFKGVGTEIGGMAAQLAALARGDLKGFTAISDAMKEDAARARVEHDKFVAGIMDRTPATVDSWGNEGRRNTAPTLGAAPRFSSGGGGRKAAGAAKGLTDAQKIEQDAQRFVAKLKEQADTFGMSGAAVLEYQMNLSKFPQVYKDEAIALQQRIDAYKAAADEDKAFADATERFMADREREIQTIEANVARIQISRMTEVEQEQLAHELILEDLQKFHDLKFENVALANAEIEAENERHKQVLTDMQAAHDLQSLGMMGNATDQLLGIMKRTGQEQTALGKAVFLASKAIAVAEILINTEVAASKAGAQMGIFGIPMAMMIRATGYASAGMVAGMAIADASAEGGYDIPSGTNPVTQLHEREMVLPKEQADVIRGLASNGGSGGGPMALTIVNQTSGRIDKVTEQRISPTERAIIIQEAVNSTAAQLSDPNSKTSRAMSRNYATQRSR